MSRHHRNPTSRGGSDSKQNISKVSPIAHKAWHVLFGNSLPSQICKIINDVWLDPNYKIEYSTDGNKFYYRHRSVQE